MQRKFGMTASSGEEKTVKEFGVNKMPLSVGNSSCFSPIQAVTVSD